MVTPVENLGYLASGGDVVVAWDKQPGEKLQGFVVQVDGKEGQKVPPAERRTSPSAATIRLPKAAATVQSFTIAETLAQRILPGDPAPSSAKHVAVTVPAWSAELGVMSE
jgi:hypothetical protein